MAHIVVLGAGIGGMSMAYEIRSEARAQDKVTVVSNHPFFQFTPSNPWERASLIQMTFIDPRQRIGMIRTSAE